MLGFLIPASSMPLIEILRGLAGSRDFQGGFAAIFFACGWLFLMAELAGLISMPPELYGHTVTQAPAEGWALLVILANFLCILSLFHDDVRGFQMRVTQALGMLANSLLFLVFSLGSIVEAVAGTIPALSPVAIFSPVFAAWSLAFTGHNIAAAVRLFRGRQQC